MLTTQATSQRTRTCAIIPTLNNYHTVRDVVHAVQEHIHDVILVDDGSAPPTEREVRRLGDEAGVTVLRRDLNGGKGAAVKDGLQRARELGFTHAFQVDADGQHDLSRIPAFLQASTQSPEALILGYPEFVGRVPTSRLRGRAFTNMWVAWEAGRDVIRDAMIGFRVYPIEQALGARPRSNRMEFDIEIVVRMVWTGMAVRNLPVAVRYLSADEGGLSSFRLFEDNARITWMHTRLSTAAFFRRIAGKPSPSP